MTKYFAILVLAVAMILTPEIEASRSIARLNQYRKRFPISGIRILYEDPEMKAKAETFVSECKSGSEDGDYGIFSKDMEGDVAKTIDAAARELLKKINAKDLSGTDESTLQLLSPLAYKIGCSENKDCEKPTVACYLNKKVTLEGIQFVDDVCETCSPTFSKCSSKVCEAESDTAPEVVPEDEPEVIESKESQSSGDVKAEQTGYEVHSNSAGSVFASFGLVCLSNLLFQVMAQ